MRLLRDRLADLAAAPARFEFDDCTVNAFDRLIFRHGLDRQDDFRIVDIKQPGAPRIADHKRIIGDRAGERVNVIADARGRGKFHPVRLDIIGITRRIYVVDLALVEVARIAVFEKYGNLFAFEHICRKPGAIQPGTRDVHLFQKHVALLFKQHKIIVRAELFFDVVHTVDLRKPAFENGDFCRVNRFLRSRGFELCEDPRRNVVIIDRTVDFDKLRGRVFVHIIQHLRKGGDPPVLFGLVKESKLNGADGQHGTQILPVINYAVLTYFVERYKQRSVAVLCALFVFFPRRKIAQYVNQLVIGTLTVVWKK